MAREPKPCGTEAAYRRHLRHDETPCDSCKRAAAEARQARWERNQRPDEERPKPHAAFGTMAAIRPDLFPGDIDPAEVEQLDVRDEQLWIYSLLKSAMRYAMPREVSSISKELRGLLGDLTKKEDDGGEEGDLQSEFEKALEARGDDDNSVGTPAAQN